MNDAFVPECVHPDLQGAESLQNCLSMMGHLIQKCEDINMDPVEESDYNIESYILMQINLFSEEELPIEERWEISNTSVRSRYDKEMKKQSLLNEEYKKVYKQKMEYDAIMAG